MLHEFMLKKVFNNSKKRISLSNHPSALFTRFSIFNNEIETKDAVYDLTSILNYDGYKSIRTRQLIKHAQSLGAKYTIFADMEDARQSNASNLYFGFNFNIFQYNRIKGDDTAVLWRLPSYFEPSRGVGHIGGAVSDDISFCEKIPKIFWRGALSGSRYVTPSRRVGVYSLKTIQDFRSQRENYSRISAVYYSTKNPEITDFKLTCELSKALQAESNFNFHSDKASPKDHLHYKYILCPLGNDVASNLYWVVSTQSLAFKEEGDYECIADYFLKPWIHYIPISKGLHDLQDKYIWCQNNEDKCKLIIENANSAYKNIIDSKYWEVNELIVLDRLGLL